MKPLPIETIRAGGTRAPISLSDALEQIGQLLEDRLLRLCPAGAERDLSILHLRTSMLWARASLTSARRLNES